MYSIRKSIAALLAALLITLCCGALADAPAIAPDGGTLIPIDEYPVVDGSTATLPLSRALMQAFTGCTEDEAYAAIRHNKTTTSFYMMADGLSDLLLVYEPSATALDNMTEYGVAYSMKPIGRDALVFLVNAANPVSDLTPAQVVDIYTGRATVWSELGGAELPIAAFQRPADSGSQVMMLNLAMVDEAIMPAPESSIVGEMGELVDTIAEYDNAEGAIGYSVWYYAANMYLRDDVKILTIGGVPADAANIESGDYPYVQPFYAVLRDDAPGDSAQRRLYDFLLTDAGQELVRGCGYAGAGGGE